MINLNDILTMVQGFIIGIVFCWLLLGLLIVWNTFFDKENESSKKLVNHFNGAIKVYFTEKGRIYAVQDNYSHSLKRIKDTLEYLKTLGITIPDDEDISIQVLKGQRYNGVMSIEFTSTTLPIEDEKQIWKLEDGSGLWEWLKY